MLPTVGAGRRNKVMKLSHAPGADQRILSLDQFRGYTIAGMFLVNFLGSYHAAHPLLKHHKTYCSYADTIMPHFFFAVGFAFRLTYLRARERKGRWPAVRHALSRNAGLLAIACAVHGYGPAVERWEQVQQLGWQAYLTASFGGSLFQTLTHIAVTSLFVLPVIGCRTRTLLLFAGAAGLLHLGLSSWFWYDWLHSHRTIDGGLLGFLTWTTPVVAGALAHDLVRARGAAGALRPLALWGAGLMLAGYALSCGNAWGHGAWLVEPPFVAPSRPVDLWTMSQKAGSLSYQAFAAGLSLSLYAACVWLCDLRRWQLTLFRTLGTNALLAYLLHGPIGDGVKKIAPRDAPLWFALAAFVLFFLVTWGVMRVLERSKIYLKL